MDFFDVVRSRHSVRSYKKKEIEKEKIEKILQAANSAPSAGNLQAYEIFLVKDREKKIAISEAALGQEFIADAPVVLVFCAHPKLSKRKYGSRGEFYSILDATIAASYAQLAASALGLGCVWIGAFDDNEMLKILGRDDVIPVAIIPIGYPAEKPEMTERRELKDIAHEI